MITLLLAVTAFFAGIANAIAGGGSFLTFPALLFAGVPAIAANASNAAALLPGTLASVWAYRNDFERVEGVGLWTMTAISLAGGVVGAALLLLTPETTFVALIPWLLLTATLVFAFGDRIARLARGHLRIGRSGVVAIQFAIAIYGGYFGGGIGILMLAIFSIFGMRKLNAMNAMKTWLSACLNGIAVVLFVAKGEIVWRETILMAATATAGGYAGAAVARTIDQRVLRVAIIAIGFGLTGYFFVR